MKQDIKVNYYDANTYEPVLRGKLEEETTGNSGETTKEPIPGKQNTVYSKFNFTTIQIFALIGMLFIVWIAIGSMLNPSKEDQTIKSIKVINGGDVKLDRILGEVRDIAKIDDDEYANIQQTGNGARYYSKYNIKAGSGGIVVQYRQYEEENINP